MIVPASARRIDKVAEIEISSFHTSISSSPKRLSTKLSLYYLPPTPYPYSTALISVPTFIVLTQSQSHS